MDIRNNKWFGQLQVSGVGSPFNHSGSIMGIIAESLKDLQGTNARVLTSGEREIILRIRDKPFSRAKELGDLDKVLDVAAELDESETMDGPEEGETFRHFVNRLIATGISPLAAEAIGADWFELQPDSKLIDWMQDSKAARFRLLNSSREAYESATPQEYAELKRYVLEQFPTLCEGLTFRQA